MLELAARCVSGGLKCLAEDGDATAIAAAFLRAARQMVYVAV